MVGELAGLGAAFAWAVGSVLFRRLGATVPPFALNLYKGLGAIVMLLIVLLAGGGHWSDVSVQALGLLALSGVLGIGIGDSAFFAALNRLGERRTVLLAETFSPPITTFIAFLALAEFLPLPAICGIVITVGGVAWVIVERGADTQTDSAKLKSGVAFGMLAAISQATGAVLSRAALTQTEIGPVWSSLLRILAGALFLVAWMPLAGHAYLPQAVRVVKPWRAVIMATFIGTFLGIFLQQLALQNAPAGVVQTLLATSSLFILPLVAMRGERISRRSIFGAIVAVAGIALLFMSK